MLPSGGAQIFCQRAKWAPPPPTQMLSYAAGVNVAMFRDGKTSREIQASTVLSKHIFFFKIQTNFRRLFIDTDQPENFSCKKERNWP